jgi:hypothetical protein
MTKMKKLMSVGALSTAALCIAFAGNTFAATAQGTANRGANRPQLTVEERTAHETEMKTKLTESLTSEVTSGKLTESQKTHVLEVMDQIHAKMVANDLAGADALRAELKAWGIEQKIDESLLPGQRNGMGRGELHKGNGQGQGNGLRIHAEK